MVMLATEEGTKRGGSKAPTASMPMYSRPSTTRETLCTGLSAPMTSALRLRGPRNVSTALHTARQGRR